MKTTSILGGGPTQPAETPAANQALPGPACRYGLEVCLRLESGDLVVLPVAPLRAQPYTPEEISRIAARCQLPVMPTQITRL